MKKPKFYVPVILLGLVCAIVLTFAVRLIWRADQPVLGAEPQQAAQAAYAPADKVVHEQFVKSATSIARPDLLACSNLDATFSLPVDGKPEEMASMLNGVWLGRRTIHGVTVEMDTAFFVKMEGNSGSAILIDRNNLGQNSFEIPLQSTRKASTAKPLMMSFVNCRYQFLDQYIKVSDSVEGAPLMALAKATKTSFSASANLKQTWSEILKAGYFNQLDARQAKLSADGTRMAMLPNGASASEKAIEGGALPGSESYLPTLVGAYFDIKLTPIVIGSRTGVSMKWFGDYFGAGVNLAPGESLTGIESGDFFREGGAFVSTVPSALASKNAPILAAKSPNTMLSTPQAQQWNTSECGDKNELAANAKATNAAASTGEPTTVTMVFDRVVIGAP